MNSIIISRVDGDGNKSACPKGAYTKQQDENK